MMLEVFLDWFTGSWNNREQAQSNPTLCNFIQVQHLPLSDNFVRCLYTYNKEKVPYRDVIVEVLQKDHLIYVKNPIMDLHFRLQNGVFVTHESHPIHNNGRDELLVTKAVLGKDHYFVNDSGYDPNTGKHLWGLSEDNYFFFKRIS